MKRILIVDDAIDLGRLLQDALKTVHPDLPISVVPSAEEALLESTRFMIDVLVTDLRLPGMSGLDLVRKIRVRQPNVKVILISGLRPDDRLFKQKDEASADIFLRKPIMTPDFLNAVDQLLGEFKTPAPTAPLKLSQPANEIEKPVEMPVQTTESEKNSAQAEVLKELAEVMPGEPVEAKSMPITTRKLTTGMLKLPGEPAAPAPAETGLSGVLSRLRSSLGAVSTMLLDERGRPVAQAGDLPDLQVESQIAPPMLSSLSAGAKISYLLGKESMELVQAYRGAVVDLVATPVSQYVLLIILPAGRGALRLALAFEEALNAQLELATVLEGMGLRIRTSVEAGAPEVLLAELSAATEQEEQAIPVGSVETILGQDPELEKLQELFKKKKTGELKLQDADSFWETASTGGQEVSQPGVLTFEQAQKLGLLPPDQKE